MMAHGVTAAPLCYSEDTTAFDARSGTFDTTTGTHDNLIFNCPRSQMKASPGVGYTVDPAV